MYKPTQTHYLDWRGVRIEIRYCLTRPPIATKRLSVDDRGRVVYCYKRPFRDGSTHVVLEPLHGWEARNPGSSSRQAVHQQ